MIPVFYITNFISNFKEYGMDIKDVKEKVNAKIEGLAFRGMAEEKIPVETRVKFP